MMTDQDISFMQRAITLAQRGLYTTDPNPRVGCVIVRDGKILSEGFHRQAGQGHAEVNALAQTLEVKGATVYVTLEPCSHIGRTPPCCDALIKAGVGRVVAGMQDPNPLVAGKGIEKLKAAGIPVSVGVLEDEAAQLNPGYIKRIQQGLPYIRLKMGISLDGRTAMAGGESQWITGPKAREDVQHLRARSSAIITGINTVLLDNARLTVRPASWYPQQIEVRQPWRVILDTTLRLPPTHSILLQPGRTLIVYAQTNSDRESALVQAGAQLIRMEGDQINLEKLMRKLAQLQCNEVLVESGPTLAGRFIVENLLDELWLYYAPKMLGHKARPLACFDLEQLADAPRFQFQDVIRLGEDVKLVLKKV